MQSLTSIDDKEGEAVSWLWRHCIYTVVSYCVTVDCACFLFLAVTVNRTVHEAHCCRCIQRTNLMWRN